MPTLDDRATCPGYRRITGATLGICSGCERNTRQTKGDLTPAAFQMLNGTWHCENRRFTALFSVVEVAADDSSPALVCGAGSLDFCAETHAQSTTPLASQGAVKVIIPHRWEA
jgi:hypothetical protein